MAAASPRRFAAARPAPAVSRGCVIIATPALKGAGNSSDATERRAIFAVVVMKAHFCSMIDDLYLKDG
jgi:hypothetical protein